MKIRSGGGHEPPGQGSARPIQMREARIEMLICKAAGPAPAVGFPSGEGVAVRGGVPVVELVDGARFAAAEQHTVRLCG